MAEMKTLNGHEIVDEKARLTRAVYYGSVAEMTADKTLAPGMSAVTKGYYKENDGGGATYSIRKSVTGDVIDGGLLHSIVNGLVAEMILPDEVVVESFGAVGDGETDDTPKFEKALATGRPVRGTNGHEYHIVNLELWKHSESNGTKSSGKISNCDFKCKTTFGNDGIILRSYAILEKCKFTGFKNAVTKQEEDGTYTVFAHIRDCLFQRNKNGVFFEMTGYESINQVIIENNYFVKNGTNADDNKISYAEDGSGYGAYISGNFCGVVIRGNVFEYNAHSGLALVNADIRYLPAADVASNYFEGNKNSAIYLNVTHQENSIHIDGNYYSKRDENVFNTNYINYVKGCSVYEMRDVNPLMAYATSGLLNEKHEIVLDNKMSSNYFTMDATNTRKYYKDVALKTGTEFMSALRIVYTAVRSTYGALVLNSGKSEIPFELVLAEGTHEAIVPRVATWYLNRIPNEGESVTIHYIGE